MGRPLKNFIVKVGIILTEDISRDEVVHNNSVASIHSSIVTVVVVVPQADDDREVQRLSATEK